MHRQRADWRDPLYLHGQGSVPFAERGEPDHASLMVALVLLSVPITFLNVLNEIAALARGTALPSCPRSISRSVTPWPCSSSACTQTSPTSFGDSGFSTSVSW